MKRRCVSERKINGKLLDEFILPNDSNACSVEWHPYSSLMACCTYTLQGKEDEEKGGTRRRVGGVGIFRVGSGDGDEEVSPLLSMEQYLALDVGVLDCKWRMSDSGEEPLLACAVSDGRILLYRIDEASSALSSAGKTPFLNPGFVCSSSSSSKSPLALALDWERGGNRIVESLSDGSLLLWDAGVGNTDLQLLLKWEGHSIGGNGIEAWLAFFSNPSQSEIVVSGGDDGLIKGWDIRMPVSAARPAFVVREHEAGVTAGCWHPNEAHTFASGSYDEHVRIWDTRSLRSPVKVWGYHCIDGGLWRLKWHPKEPDVLLAACMHAGAVVLHREEGEVVKFTGHKSMVYGADWCRSGGGSQSDKVIATCSFYDCRLCLWEVAQ